MFLELYEKYLDQDGLLHFPYFEVEDGIHEILKISKTSKKEIIDYSFELLQ